MRMTIGLILITAIALFATNAAALMYETYGDVDQLVYSGSLGNSGDAAEIQFIADYLGVDPTEINDYDKDSELAGDWSPLDSGIYAYDFVDKEPGLFLIKTGNIQGNDNDTFLFDNLEVLQYAVVDLADLGISSDNIEKISHIGWADGTTPVPEPSTLLLLGAGLAGFAIYRRKRS